MPHFLHFNFHFYTLHCLYKCFQQAPHLQVDGLACIDNSVSDGGTVDDSAKDVDEDCLHLVVLSDDAERLLYL